MFFTIITAGGKGLRMKSDIPKQFLLLKGKPILMHSIETFAGCGLSPQIFLVLPEAQINYWQNLCLKFSFNIKHEIVSGGKERFFSVKNALDKIHEEGITAIHDGVRPLVSKKTILDCYKAAQENQTAIPYSDITESIRKIEGDKNEYANRDHFKLIATPQIFNTNLIKTAYKQPYSTSYTDSASVVEKLGIKINLIKGNPENIKVTTQTDLLIAEILIQKIKTS